MTASRLRRVGNLGAQLDPASVDAVFAIHKPPGVMVALMGGITVLVVDLTGEDPPRPATAEDIAHVCHQLTLRST